MRFLIFQYKHLALPCFGQPSLEKAMPCGTSVFSPANSLGKCGLCTARSPKPVAQSGKARKGLLYSLSSCRPRLQLAWRGKVKNF